MLSKYPFKLIARYAVFIIFGTLLLTTSLGVYVAHSSYSIVKSRLHDNIEILAVLPELMYEFYNENEVFVELFNEQSQAVEPCLAHLDKVQKILNRPAFLSGENAGIKQNLEHLQRQSRTMLYQYQSADLKDPTRDYGKETLGLIKGVMKQSEEQAIAYCNEVHERTYLALESLTNKLRLSEIYLGVMLSVGLVLIVSVVLLMRQALNKRLRAIIAAADNIRKGNTNYRIDTPFDDEMGQVARSIDNMAERIHVKENQLLTINKKLNESLKLAQQADLAKSQFLANMSHEIRTPMNAIMGFSKVLCGEKLDEEQHKYANFIHSSAKNLLTLLNDILDISKIEAGKLEIELIETSLEEILCNLDSIMRPAATDKEIEFKVLHRNAIPAEIICDPTRLYQCLVNLTTNAIKFTESGHVYVKVRCEGDDAEAKIYFEIEDTGIGIEGDKIDTVFDTFSQADNSTTRKYGGTGLGLTITRQLVEMLGGNIYVESKPGTGSTFSFYVPARVDVGSVEKLGAENTARYLKGGTEDKMVRYAGHVLVAEDNFANQKLVELLLHRAGFAVTIVDNGQKAVEAASANEFDLIIMDMQMPVLSGYDATGQIRQVDENIPIVALTANAMSGDSEKCIEAGCNDYIAKPVDIDKLRPVLDKYFEPAVSA